MRFWIRTEHEITGADGGGQGEALAKVVERHPLLLPLLDYSSPDPVQVAREIGMLFPAEEDAEEDLQEIDLGPPEWFEALAGLAAVQQALEGVRADPDSIGAVLYDPRLTPGAVIADLEDLARRLLSARQQETRFHFVLEN